MRLSMPSFSSPCLPLSGNHSSTVPPFKASSGMVTYAQAILSSTVKDLCKTRLIYRNCFNIFLSTNIIKNYDIHSLTKKFIQFMLTCGTISALVVIFENLTKHTFKWQLFSLFHISLINIPCKIIV